MLCVGPATARLVPSYHKISKNASKSQPTRLVTTQEQAAKPADYGDSEQTNRSKK
jgi:hypothetical protein